MLSDLARITQWRVFTHHVLRRYNEDVKIFGLFCFLVTFTSWAADGPVYEIGPDVVAPFVAAKPAPTYSDEARLAKLEGSVLLSVVVNADGSPGEIRVRRPLGLGLDEIAVANARTWKFRPGTRNGKPVAVRTNQEVFFRPGRALWDWHVARAVFNSPESAARPVLIQTKFPPTVDEEENTSVTVAFVIDAKGVPTECHAVKSSNPKWEHEIVDAIQKGWRFRPGTVDGKPVATAAWFELVRGSHSPIAPYEIPGR